MGEQDREGWGLSLSEARHASAMAAFSAVDLSGRCARVLLALLVTVTGLPGWSLDGWSPRRERTPPRTER